MLTVNAMYRWLNDKNRIQRLEQSKSTGEFYYIDENKIEDDVRKLFFT